MTEGVRIDRDQLATFGHQGLIDLIYCADYGNITDFFVFRQFQGYLIVERWLSRGIPNSRSGEGVGALTNAAMVRKSWM